MPASIQVPRSAWLRRAVGSVVQAVADYRVVVGVRGVCVVATWIANDGLGVHPSSADIERGTRRPDLTPTPEDPPARRPQPKPSPNASRPPPNTASRPSRPGSPDSERDTEFWPGRALWVFCGISGQGQLITQRAGRCRPGCPYRSFCARGRSSASGTRARLWGPSRRWLWRGVLCGCHRRGLTPNSDSFASRLREQARMHSRTSICARSRRVLGDRASWSPQGIGRSSKEYVPEPPQLPANLVLGYGGDTPKRA